MQRVNWVFVRPLWETGTLSNCELVKQYREAHKDQTAWKAELDESAIRHTARRKGWKKNLADRVRQQVKEKLIRTFASGASQSDKPRTGGGDDHEVDQAAGTISGLIELQRSDIEQLKHIEADLRERLKADEQVALIGWYQGMPTEHETRLNLADRAAILQRLAAVMARRIGLERQAWGLDESERRAPATIEIVQQF